MRQKFLLMKAAASGAWGLFLWAPNKMTMSEVRGEGGVQTFGPMVFIITSFVFGLTV